MNDDDQTLGDSSCRPGRRPCSETETETALNARAGLRKSGLKRTVIITIVCTRFVILPLIGIAVVHAAYGVGFLSHDPLYRYVLMVQFALPPAMNIGTRY